MELWSWESLRLVGLYFLLPMGAYSVLVVAALWWSGRRTPTARGVLCEPDVYDGVDTIRAPRRRQS